VAVERGFVLVLVVWMDEEAMLCLIIGMAKFSSFDSFVISTN